MDEGSEERSDGDRDGWSEMSGCTGARQRRAAIHRCTEETWEQLWKNDKSRSWRRRDNEQKQRIRRERERLRPRGRDESGMERYRVGDGEEEENKTDSGKNMDVPGTNQPSSAPLSSSFSPFKTVALF